ncbi:MAG: DUF1616 domain-containing protein [Thermoplasmata archaeon]|nr:DUF1616 domain-containing protein [Thermoplasmata archaeon]
MATLVAEALIGFLLVFVLPGFTLAKALFPEKRVRSPHGSLWLVELATLTVFLSVVLTVLVGFGLLNLAPGGLAASWTNPVLETVLAAIAVVGLVVGVFRGAYRKDPPAAPTLEASPGADDGWGLLRRLELAHRDERRLRHALRQKGLSTAEEDRVHGELDRVTSEIHRLRQEREGQYAQ